jgi:hypothetical protein
VSADSVFFAIYIEPLLAFLERSLRGLFMGILREASIVYMDDINELVDEDDNNIVVTYQTCRAFEGVLTPSLTATEKLWSLALVPGWLP